HLQVEKVDCGLNAMELRRRGVGTERAVGGVGMQRLQAGPQKPADLPSVTALRQAEGVADLLERTPLEIHVGPTPTRHAAARLPALARSLSGAAQLRMVNDGAAPGDRPDDHAAAA